MALITIARAASLIPEFASDDTGVLTDIVNASSDLIEKWCNRTFAVTAYDELYPGSGFPNLLLNNYPITQIDRVMSYPSGVISIGNTSTAVSRASFRLTSSALILTSVASGVTTTRTITRSSYLTFADLSAAINTYSADGWTSLVLGNTNFGTWSTADLWSPQGGQEIRWIGYGYLWHHLYGVPVITQKDDIGEIVSSFGFDRGDQKYRVIYSAGFPVIPLPVQQACAELAASVFTNREVNPNLASENLGGYSYATIAEKSFNNLSIASRYALYQYKSTRIVRFKID